jgi:hypothetical protein
MNLQAFKRELAEHQDLPVRFILPDGASVAAHAHVTEAARIDKHFIDCGGTVRTETYCRLQTWVHTDVDHRLVAKKLLGILNKAADILKSEELTVDVEHEVNYISQFPVTRVTPDITELRIELGVRNTACLAMDLCCPQPPASLVNETQLHKIGSRS